LTKSVSEISTETTMCESFCDCTCTQCENI